FASGPLPLPAPDCVAGVVGGAGDPSDAAPRPARRCRRGRGDPGREPGSRPLYPSARADPADPEDGQELRGAVVRQPGREALPDPAVDGAVDAGADVEGDVPAGGAGAAAADEPAVAPGHMGDLRLPVLLAREARLRRRQA